MRRLKGVLILTGIIVALSGIGGTIRFRDKIVTVLRFQPQVAQKPWIGVTYLVGQVIYAQETVSVEIHIKGPQHDGLLVAQGTCAAGTDYDTRHPHVSDHGRSIIVKIPQPTILGCKLVDARFVGNSPSGELSAELLAVALEELQSQAQQSDLLKTAQGRP